MSSISLTQYNIILYITYSLGSIILSWITCQNISSKRFTKLWLILALYTVNIEVALELQLINLTIAFEINKLIKLFTYIIVDLDK